MPRYGFCPSCNTQVLLKREDIDICLAVILLIFTVGIGLILYLVYYYNKQEDRCNICGIKITSSQSPGLYGYDNQPRNQYASISKITQPPEEFLEELDIPRFCPLCGEKIVHGIFYCPKCGGKVKND